jgi:hypothetical protein
MKLNQFLIPLTSLALISIASPSYATDYKVYPGSACQPALSTDSFRTEMIGITNTSTTQTVSVNCPIVRDRIPVPIALDPGVRVASSNGFTLQCLFYSLDQNGKVLDIISRSTTASTPTALVFSEPGRNIKTQAAGSYNITCILPPKARVINYSIGESGETGNAELP